MPTSKPEVPNSAPGGDDPSSYKAKIDAGFNAQARLGWAFAPHAQDTPNMTVRLEAGAIFEGTTLTEVAAQNTGTITAPVTHPRIDRVVIDRATGAVSVVTGTEAASPAAPAIPSGKLPVAQVLLATSTTSITNALITDERIAGGAGVTIGSIDDPSETEVPSTQDVADALAAIPQEDTTARDIAIRNAIKLGLLAGDASGTIPAGYLWLFKTDELATKTGATYDPTGDYYHNTESTTAISGTEGTTITGTFDINTSAAFDGNESQASTPCARCSTNGSISTARIGKQWSAAKRIGRFRVVGASDTGLVYSGASEDYTIALRGSNDGSSYTVLYTSATITDAAGKVTDVATGIDTANAYTYHDVVFTCGGNTNFALCEVVFYEYVPPSDMTLVPAANTAGAAPASVDIYLLHKPVVAVTLNTDIKARVSRDNGANWSGYVTLEQVATYDTDYVLLKGTADLSALASGTSVKWEVTSYNTKSQRLRGAAIILN